MAENSYVNKVVFGNDTLVDLTEDSVTANTLLEGETAHSASGEPITGTAKQGHIIWNAIKTALSPQRLKLWFADAKVTDDSTEQATKVEVVQLIDDESELTNAPDGVYQGDYEDAPEDVLDASMVAYGNGSVEDALDELTDSGVYPITFESGIDGNMYIAVFGKIGVIGGYFHNTSALTSNTKIATCPYLPKSDFIIYGGNYGDMLTVYTNGDVKTSQSLTSLQVGYYAVGGTIIID